MTEVTWATNRYWHWDSVDTGRWQGRGSITWRVETGWAIGQTRITLDERAFANVGELSSVGGMGAWGVGESCLAWEENAEELA